MAPLRDKYYLNFRGGIRNDLSDYEKDATEVVKIINFDIDRPGLTRRRLGSIQTGQTLDDDKWVENSTFFQRVVSGGNPDPFFLCNQNESAPIQKLIGSYAISNLVPGVTFVLLDDASDFPASGSFEIEGDVVSYTSKAADTLLGLTGVTSKHGVGAPVNMWVDLDSTDIGGTEGVSYAALNDLLMIQGHYTTAYTWDGTSMTEITDGNYPQSAYATVYRQRVYVQGGGSGEYNVVSFSDAGDATSWNADNYFVVEDQRMEGIVGFRVLNDELLIWKTSSFFGYNEVNLKQRSYTVGTYNNKTHQEIGGLAYTFCPQGVFRTDGINTKRISDPIKDWIDNFRPKTLSTRNVIVYNTCSAQFDGKFMIYIDQTVVGGVTYNDVVLVYDTIRLNWTVYTGVTNMRHMVGYNTFYYGGNTQIMKSLFGGNTQGQFFRFFSKTYVDSDNNVRFNGAAGEIFSDFFSDSSAVISAEIQFPMLDLGVPYHKTVGFLRVFTRDKGFVVSVRKEDDNGVSDWIGLGEVTKPNQLFRLPDNFEGYRFGVSITHTEPNSAPTLNGFGFEDIEITTTERPTPRNANG